jgi:hypothetical protein
MNLRGNLLPMLAVAGGAAAALFGLGMRPHSVAAPREIRPEAPSPPAAPIPDEGSPSKTATTLAGEVLERIDVEKYTYLRIGEPGALGTWAAVPSAKNVRVGDRVSVRSAELMTQFASATLKRTFDAIYFGVLGDGVGSNVGDSAANSPHAVAAAAGGQVEKVARAKGALGRTVAELFAERAALEGKTARVHAVVVKCVEGVLGKNFLHVKDGSGSAADSDLAVTTSALPVLGSRVLLEGTVAKDKDFGMGYRYPVLLEDARLVGE